MKYSLRGFAVYGEFVDIGNQPIKVKEASNNRPSCYIFIEDDKYAFDDGLGNKIPPAIQLSVKNTKTLIKQLSIFVKQNDESKKVKK